MNSINIIDYATYLALVSSTPETENFHSQYVVLKTIGRGGFGEVKLAHHRLTGTPVAIKVLQRKMWCFRVKSEVNIMKMINHPNIISLIQVIEDEKKTYLIMELVEGKQLYQHVLKAGHLEEDHARGIFRQILSAVSYCHEHGIIHRDLKPDNIMLDGNGKVKIIDFGLGTQVKPGQKLSFYCGTYQLFAPEFWLGRLYDGPKVDIWTLGVILYFMVVGKFPFDADSIPELQDQVVKGKYTIPLDLSKELRDLLSLLMTVNPRRRPTVDEVVTHPWLKKDMEASPNYYEEMVPSLPDPAIVEAMKRIGFQAQDIKDSLQQRKYNQTMATYCLLKGQALQWPICTTLDQPVNPGVAPFPSLEDPVAFPLPPRRRSSEPTLGTLLRGSSTSGQLSAYGQQAGQRGGRRATEYAIPHQRTLTLDEDHPRSKSLPCIYSRSTSSDNMEDNFRPNRASAKGKSTRSHGQPRGLRAWTRRIGNALRRLCCCFPSRQNKVFPQK
ncbi:sperm motility kinase 2B-like [Peromyscus leucopus]|uniref:sperm motility kinase 2B-like n=1 Tax=Peromyscus leucopus TaxID=10041 RepID=UPI0018849BFF|nr:sperm motility kinase 2B-like [Peromyscus leucopus]